MSLPADCYIVPNTDSKLTLPSIVLPRGALRLGEVMDKIRYTLSGRDDHIEENGTILNFGVFALSPADNNLLHRPTGTTLRLTDKERLMLRVLYEAGEGGLPRSDLLKSVWGYVAETETHTLETHLYRLRQKLEPYDDGVLIKVENGVYVLIR